MNKQQLQGLKALALDGLSIKDKPRYLVLPVLKPLLKPVAKPLAEPLTKPLAKAPENELLVKYYMMTVDSLCTKMQS
jgi:hypothetical protein